MRLLTVFTARHHRWIFGGDLADCATYVNTGTVPPHWVWARLTACYVAEHTIGCLRPPWNWIRLVYPAHCCIQRRGETGRAHSDLISLSPSMSLTNGMVAASSVPGFEGYKIIK